MLGSKVVDIEEVVLHLCQILHGQSLPAWSTVKGLRWSLLEHGLSVQRRRLILTLDRSALLLEDLVNLTREIRLCFFLDGFIALLLGRHHADV